MTGHHEFLLSEIARYEPQLAIDELVVRLNRIYHAFEARDYDRRHPEIHRQLPPLWREMIATAEVRTGSTPWTVLDFGSGTGFEALQLLTNPPGCGVVNLVCYDQSPVMLERCRSKVAPVFPSAQFHSDLAEVLGSGLRFNVLLTNSLLHHLVAPAATMGQLLPSLSDNAVWLAGHEPSRRFFQNPERRSVHAQYQRSRWLSKFRDPRAYLARIRRWTGLSSNPASDIAGEAVRLGIFKSKPTGKVSSHLVDFHVADTDKHADQGRGFDHLSLQQQLTGMWDLALVRTYSFMGTDYEGKLPRRWAKAASDLARRYPDDGANFCTVWTRHQPA